MNNSLKVGIISGLIAGIISAIVYEIFNNIALSLDLFEPYWRPLQTGNIITFIPFFGFFGIVFGIIYSRTYDIIPKKGIWKGLIYGLFLYFFAIVRLQTFLISYGLLLNAAGELFTGFFSMISLGLVLGILYEFLKNRYHLTKEIKKIVTYDMSSGVLPGAIAGLCGGLAASVFAVIGHATGYWGVPSGAGSQILSTIEFWWSQAGTHIFYNMIWGTIFGAFFTKVYYLIPSKKVLKGLYYGLIVYLIASFYPVAIWTFKYLSHGQWEIALQSLLSQSTGFAQAIAFGIVLGYLYRKPPK